MAPIPTCPLCNDDFVEEISEDNDPREFVDQTGHELETDEETDDVGNTPNGSAGTAPNDVVQMVTNLIQSMLGPHVPFRVETRTYGDNNEGPNITTTTTTTITTDAGATTTTTTTNEQPVGGEQNRPNVFFTMGTNQGNGQEGGEARGTNMPLLNLAQMLHRAFGEGAQQGGITPWMNVLNIVGDPRDYVWGAGGLDNIISQLMEQQAGRQAPPPASDEIINKLPKVKINKTQVVEEQLNCPVCKDDFKEAEEATTLPCKHAFHDECIRPWLKMNGTCPVCRYSLVQQDGGGNDQNRNDGSSSSGAFNGNIFTGNGTNGNFNGNGTSANGNFNSGSFNAQ
ncbi:hypothetical protein G9A89_023346 [Geosiphon pyriformis]|nr:hypothetical protein G9A89_023346 [Geosiphon pyriformis]